MSDYKALSKLKNYYLGEDWHVDDPITNYQFNEILVTEIISKYPKQHFSMLLALNLVVLILNIAIFCGILKF